MMGDRQKIALKQRDMFFEVGNQNKRNKIKVLSICTSNICTYCNLIYMKPIFVYNTSLYNKK